MAPESGVNLMPVLLEAVRQHVTLGEAMTAWRRYSAGIRRARVGRPEKGVRTLLCAAPFGPFRQKGPDPLFISGSFRPWTHSPDPRAADQAGGSMGHDRWNQSRRRGAARCRMEVIYTALSGSHPSRSPSAAADEDVDALASACLSGAHLSLIPRLLPAEEQGIAHIPVIVGRHHSPGMVPMCCSARGIARIFRAGDPHRRTPSNSFG